MAPNRVLPERKRFARSEAVAHRPGLHGLVGIACPFDGSQHLGPHPENIIAARLQNGNNENTRRGILECLRGWIHRGQGVGGEDLVPFRLAHPCDQPAQLRLARRVAKAVADAAAEHGSTAAVEQLEHVRFALGERTCHVVVLGEASHQPIVYVADPCAIVGLVVKLLVGDLQRDDAREEFT